MRHAWAVGSDLGEETQRFQGSWVLKNSKGDNTYSYSDILFNIMQIMGFVAVNKKPKTIGTTAVNDVSQHTSELSPPITATNPRAFTGLLKQDRKRSQLAECAL